MFNKDPFSSSQKMIK